MPSPITGCHLSFMHDIVSCLHSYTSPSTIQTSFSRLHQYRCYPAFPGFHTALHCAPRFPLRIYLSSILNNRQIDTSHYSSLESTESHKPQVSTLCGEYSATRPLTFTFQLTRSIHVSPRSLMGCRRCTPSPILLLTCLSSPCHGSIIIRLFSMSSFHTPIIYALDATFSPENHMLTHSFTKQNNGNPSERRGASIPAYSNRLPPSTRVRPH